MYIAVYPRKSKFRKDSISIESQIEFCKHEIKEGEKFGSGESIEEITNGEEE